MVSGDEHDRSFKLALINDPEHWRSRAEETCVLAEDMTDENARATMMGKVVEI
jgi:hypothetical protein